jgi:hypothetical protein
MIRMKNSTAKIEKAKFRRVQTRKKRALYLPRNALDLRTGP